MNVFKPATLNEIELDKSGHYSLSGEYQGTKFVIDDVNPLSMEASLDIIMDEIAMRAATKVTNIEKARSKRRFCSRPDQPFNPPPNHAA